MERREFLIRSAKSGAVLVLVPAGWTLACNSSTSNGTSTDAAAGTTGSTGSGLRYTSDVVSGHSHDFTIVMTDLSSPSAAGLSGQTTVAQSHTHTVSLTLADLMQIESGAAVTKQTSTVLSHLHTFQFSLAAGVSTGTSGTAGSGGASGADGGGASGAGGGASGMGGGGASGTGGGTTVTGLAGVGYQP
jgi:hypothetical protein